MANPRTFKRLSNVEVLQNTQNATTNTRYYLPYRPDIEKRKIRAISLSNAIIETLGIYLTILNKKGETIICQFPVSDLSLNNSTYTFGQNPQRLRLFCIEDIDTGASFLEIKDVTQSLGIVQGLSLANLVFYTD